MKKGLIFIGSSQKDIRDFPERIQSSIGYALYQIQLGERPSCVKPWKGLGPGVLEILDDFDGGTYRAVYTVRFDKVVYVLHCFQKKSKHGIETPPKDRDLVRKRLRAAYEHFKTNYGAEK